MQPDREGRFPKRQFKIDLAANSCTCPAGNTTFEVRPIGWRWGADRTKVQQEAYVFPREVCAARPLQPRCYKHHPSSGRGRVILRHPEEALRQAAREWRHGPDFNRFRKHRQVVEHRLARLMQMGLRRARYRSRHKTLFKMLMTAAVANLTLLAGQLNPSRPSPQPRGIGREQPATSLPGIQAPTPTALELLVAIGTQLRRFAARPVRLRLTTRLALATPTSRPRV